MLNQATFTLVNPQNSNLVFKYLEFEDNSFFDHIQRDNCFSLIWVTSGNGKLKADFTLTKGPGNVGKALGIFKKHSGLHLLDDDIYVVNDGTEINEDQKLELI